MKLRDILLCIWLILAGIIPILTVGLKSGILGLAIDIIINVGGWYLFFRLIFFIFDKLKKNRPNNA